jgi:hypothetical protein
LFAFTLRGLIVLSLSFYYSVDVKSRQVSLTTPPPTDARGLAQGTASADVTEETFLKAMDNELTRVESFTLAKVMELRQAISKVEGMLNSLTTTGSVDELLEQADEIAEAFLRLEKYGKSIDIDILSCPPLLLSGFQTYVFTK